jgi:hypothetical protein
MKENTPLTQEQIDGLEWKRLDDEARYERIRQKHNIVSPQRQKAIDFVKNKSEADKRKEEFLK